jgi:hypothetical protein
MLVAYTAITEGRKLLLIKPAARSYFLEHKSLRAPPHRSGNNKGR